MEIYMLQAVLFIILVEHLSLSEVVFKTNDVEKFLADSDSSKIVDNKVYLTNSSSKLDKREKYK